MKLTVLVDNNTLIDRYLLGEPAVSYLLEDGERRILFDVGYSDVLIRNAQTLGIDLLEVDAIVLSHGHLDHTWGLAPLLKLRADARFAGHRPKRPALVAHPLTLAPKTDRGHSQLGSLLGEEELGRHFDLELGREPRWLTEHVVFLGEIERVTGFEARRPMGSVVVDGVAQADDLRDDSALACVTPSGLVIVTGCSHSGICNIVETARKICGPLPVVDIVGGFHLLHAAAEVLEGTVEYMRALGPTRLHPCHCTDLASKMALAGVAPVHEVGSGLVLEL